MFVPKLYYIINKIKDCKNILQDTYDERFRRYEEARERIFSEKQVAAVKGLSNKVKKARMRYKNRKLIRNLIVAAVNRVEQADNRPYAEVLISDKPCRGLLDTGASISLLGKGCKDFVPNRVTKMFSSV